MISPNEKALLQVIRAALLGKELPALESQDWNAILQEARAGCWLGH